MINYPKFLAGCISLLWSKVLHSPPPFPFLLLDLLLVLISSSNQLADDQVLLEEPLLPARHRLELVPGKIGQGIQRPVQILGEHLLVEAALRQTSRRIAASEVFVRPTRSVEVAPAGNVEHATTDGEVHRLAVLTIVGKKGARGKCTENNGGLLLREGDGGLRLEEGEGGVEDDAEEEQVERGEEGAIVGNTD